VKDTLRASYDRSANTYDRDFADLQAVKYEAMLGQNREMLDPIVRAGGRFLDVGCGTGLLAGWLIVRGVCIRDLIGIDLSLGMARMARSRLRIAVHGDKDRLPFAARSFDAVLAFTALHIWEASEAAALGEIRRVIRPGGLFVVTVLARRFSESIERGIIEAGFTVHDRRPCGQDVGLLALAP